MEIVFHKRGRPRKKDGALIIEDLDYVRVALPDGTIVDRPVKEDDKLRWPKQWSAYSKPVDQAKPAESTKSRGWKAGK